MSFISLPRAHQAQLEQLTGCRYATLVTLTAAVRAQLLKGRGRPFKHSVLVMVALSLMKLRLNLTVRALEALTGIDSVTVSRCVNRVPEALGALPLAGKAPGFLLVDTTSIRVATTQKNTYSGHKHQRCAKVQVIARRWPGRSGGGRRPGLGSRQDAVEPGARQPPAPAGPADAGRQGLRRRRWRGRAPGASAQAR